jgi:L-ascorbate metabolism protein UlaG (beta-lactamase superfamily)
MKKIIFFSLFLVSFQIMNAQFQKDTYKTSGGDLSVTFIGHGTLMMEINGKVIHVDPVGQFADYATLPKADLVLVTHQHGDHLDPAAIAKILKSGTEIIMPLVCKSKLPEGKILKNGESGTFAGFPVEAVAAYNIKNERAPGQPFHPKGEGNGYLIRFGTFTVYVAGDTENTPEMKALKNIDVAFLPMNLPFTMTPEMVADAAIAFRPKILYPYHYGDTDPEKLVQLLKGQNIDVRIRNLK